LLYAGTEFGMFVSFDDGATWLPFQLNLPATPITDLRVHRKDLVASTMGRSFWILDDLSPLHGLTSGIDSLALHAFAPREAYRIRWSPPAEAFDGAPAYPAFGASLYYTIGDTLGLPVTVDIVDPAGQTIRSFSSDTSAAHRRELESMRGPAVYLPEQAALGTERGLHRFVWDFGHAGPARLRGQGAAEAGPLAAPGIYTVRFQRGRATASVSLTVHPDPRLAADGVSPADLAALEQFGLRLRDRLTALRGTVDEIRAVRSPLARSTDDAAKTLVERLTSLEQQLMQTGAGKVGAQLKPMLQEQFAYLNEMLSYADQRPGEDAYLRLADLERELETALAAVRQIVDHELPAVLD
jgi:hypothetical protein